MCQFFFYRSLLFHALILSILTLSVGFYLKMVVGKCNGVDSYHLYKSAPVLNNLKHSFKDFRPNDFNKRKCLRTYFLLYIVIPLFHVSRDI